MRAPAAAGRGMEFTALAGVGSSMGWAIPGTGSESLAQFLAEKPPRRGRL